MTVSSSSVQHVVVSKFDDNNFKTFESKDAAINALKDLGANAAKAYKVLPADQHFASMSSASPSQHQFAPATESDAKRVSFAPRDSSAAENVDDPAPLTPKTKLLKKQMSKRGSQRLLDLGQRENIGQKRNLEAAEQLKQRDAAAMETVKKKKYGGVSQTPALRKLTKTIREQTVRTSAESFGTSAERRIAHLNATILRNAAQNLSDDRLGQITDKQFSTFADAKPLSIADKFTMVAGEYTGNLTNSMTVKINTFLGCSQTGCRNSVLDVRENGVMGQALSISQKIADNLNALGVSDKQLKKETSSVLALSEMLNGEGIGTCGPISELASVMMTSFMNNAIELLESDLSNEQLKEALPLVAEMSDEQLGELRDEDTLATLREYAENIVAHQEDSGQGADHNITTISSESRAFTVDAWSTSGHSMNAYGRGNADGYSEAKIHPVDLLRGGISEDIESKEQLDNWLGDTKAVKAPTIPWEFIQGKLSGNTEIQTMGALLGDLSSLGLSASEEKFISDVSYLDRSAMMALAKHGANETPHDDNAPMMARKVEWLSSHHGDSTDTTIASDRAKHMPVFKHIPEIRQTLENHKFSNGMSRHDIAEELFEATMVNNSRAMQQVIKDTLIMAHPNLASVEVTPKDDPHQFKVTIQYDATPDADTEDLRTVNWNINLNNKFDRSIQDILVTNYRNLMGYEAKLPFGSSEAIHVTGKREIIRPSVQEQEDISPSPLMTKGTKVDYSEQAPKWAQRLSAIDKNLAMQAIDVALKYEQTWADAQDLVHVFLEDSPEMIIQLGTIIALSDETPTSWQDALRAVKGVLEGM
ncbi:hypothetical protein [Algicola sagamiensis]|uniref:hypothetical protein n=1 Tax=Algicola sagamiensis TaxID=163869 RepID=UPI000377D269|nr:hypothetical protein [Algicola sagamiensis]